MISKVWLIWWKTKLTWLKTMESNDRTTIINDVELTHEGGHCCGRKACTLTKICGSFIIGCTALVILLIVRPRQQINPEYGVVFDAGSSHTTVYLYRWPGNERLGGTAVPVDEIYSSSHQPGISSFVNNPELAGNSIANLIKKVSKNVPANKRSSTPIYVGATAGMRLVKEVKPDVAYKIMLSISHALDNSGFLIPPNSSKIISGVEEGSWGWITTNYLMNILQKPSELPKMQSSACSLLLKPACTYSVLNVSPGCGYKSFAALDMGGASTEITFMSPTSGKRTLDFRLYGKNYTIYTRSYLCYGLNEVYRRYLAQLAKSANYSSKISNPCARRGSNFNQSGKYIWKKPCSCEPSRKPGRDNFTFFGSNNRTECNKNLIKLFRFSSTCDGAKDFTNHSQPKLKGSFIAFSGYAFVRAGLNLSVTPTMKKYKSAYLSFCDKRGSQIHEQPRVSSRRTPLCFAGHYIYVLLTHGYGFSSETWDIAFEDTVGKKHLGWSLGFMINATNLIPLNQARRLRIKDTFLIPALVVAGIFVLVSFILAVRFFVKIRSKSAYYPI
ncbi:ectonucleoside triphosphate diphosphohydrolase 8-like [Xenia sp. Carnegie-2017]|uniref:ectonucleoside triphosphate diphosphohydrolase 8-like n=1 Tax=Xenia sp. Carnegie-2017 TaxID=2897299 RepID=UPI001F04BC40|nr:ectonucleoside triphosphate diphosphohydrolase 8-like [Xenia sp. Carnegie-2017]